MLKNLLGENVKVNQGAYFIGAAKLFFAGPNCFEYGSKVGSIPLILYENVKKYLVKMLTHQNKRTIPKKLFQPSVDLLSMSQFSYSDHEIGKVWLYEDIECGQLLITKDDI